MIDLINYLLTPLVEDLSQIEIIENKQDKHIEYLVKAPKSDMGHIIGKQGKLITSLRQLVRLRGIIDQTNVNLKVEEK